MSYIVLHTETITISVCMREREKERERERDRERERERERECVSVCVPEFGLDEPGAVPGPAWRRRLKGFLRLLYLSPRVGPVGACQSRRTPPPKQ